MRAKIKSEDAWENNALSRLLTAKGRAKSGAKASCIVAWKRKKIHGFLRLADCPAKEGRDGLLTGMRKKRTPEKARVSTGQGDECFGTTIAIRKVRRQKGLGRKKKRYVHGEI